MDISLQSLLYFIIITMIYFSFPSIGKPALTLEDLTNAEAKANYFSRTNKSLAFYLGIVVISQFFLNMAYLMGTCGGAINNNVWSAAIFTFIPWVLIFGVLIAVLMIFPGFKSAFSDVIGYYVVAGRANDLLSSMLRGSDINQLIENAPPEEKDGLTKAADAIIKIIGNKSILINQMNPQNFLDIWEALKELMNPNVYEDTEIKTKLLNLVVLKDNVGEGLWYTYAAILISSIVYYNLATQGCVKDVNQIKADHDAYIKQQEEAAQQAELNNSVTYVAS